jgi:regulatory LuxR family protein
VRACGQAGAVPPPGLAEPLTGRELEVLRLLAAGWSNQRSARDLVVALDAVKKHVTTSWASSVSQPDRGRRAGPAARPDPLIASPSRSGSTFG